MSYSCGCLNVQDIDTACRNIAARLRPGNPANDSPFGGLHFVATGDFAQHDPVQARVLYHGSANTEYMSTPMHTAAVPGQAAAASSTAASTQRTTAGRESGNARVGVKDVAGRNLWLLFDQCIILQNCHRFNLSDPSGRALYELVCQITTGKDLQGQPLTRDAVAAIADTINDCAVPPSDMPAFLQCKPKALVLRHIHRPPLTRTLVSHHASVDKTRVLVWRAKDSIVSATKSGKELSPAILSMLESSAVHPDKLPAVMYFYPGIPYRFVSNEFPLLGWVNNAECVGHSIILNSAEPPDPMTGDFHVLKYPPVAIMVSIVGRDITGLFQAPVPPNCIPIFPKFSQTFTVDWSKTSVQIKLYKDKNDLESANKFSVRRTSFPLETALTFTDFFAQGQSFKGAPHLLHLNIGQREAYKKANILVPVSRPANLSDLKLAHPLWPTGDGRERERIIDKFYKALQPSPDYEAEMKRLTALHTKTMTDFDQHHNSTMDIITPTISPRLMDIVPPTAVVAQRSASVATPTPTSRTANPAATPKAAQHIPATPQQQVQAPAAAASPATDPDYIITMETRRHDFPEASQLLQLRLSIIGRAQCGYGDTEGLGDCGPLSILQSLLLQAAPLMHSDGSLADIIKTSQEQADLQCAALRSAICTTIHQHQDLQRIATILFARQPWQRIASELGTCVAVHRRRRHHQSGSGTWMNSIGLRACARHLQRDIIVLAGPSGNLTLFPCSAGPHIDNLGDSYDTDKDTCIDCSLNGFIPASAFDARTIIIRNDSDHFWCTRPIVPRGEDLQMFLQQLHAEAMNAGHHVRYLQPQAD